MLIQLIANHPEALVTIVSRTPTYVWGLLAGLTALGASQLRDRTASLVRVSLMPVAMTTFSAWGTVAAFGNSPVLGEVLAVWLATAIVLFSLMFRTQGKARYDAATRNYFIPGSVLPLALILGIFLVKYFVGVELAMAPQLMRDTQYALTVAGLYGAFTGIFVGRAARLWRLALRTPATLATA